MIILPLSILLISKLMLYLSEFGSTDHHDNVSGTDHIIIKHHFLRSPFTVPATDVFVCFHSLRIQSANPVHDSRVLVPVALMKSSMSYDMTSPYHKC